MIELPEKFLLRMREQLSDEYEQFLNSYSAPPARAIRVNTLKISVDKFTGISPFSVSPVPWEPSGFYVEGEGLGKTVLHAAGAYYVQEPSAMAVVPKLDIRRGDRVLDLCSAPGGKGTQIAQYLDGSGVLVMNEPYPARKNVLAENVERLGVKNAAVSCAEPDYLAGLFEGYFNKILVDAPCSGEGMFKKEPNAIPEWSLENVKMCAARQYKILEAADKMLCGGGRLVYSTCTFAPEEDERQISGFLERHREYSLISVQKLYPHKIRGEGHFIAVLQKTQGPEAEDFHVFRQSYKPSDVKAFREWEAASMRVKTENLIVVGNMLFSFCDGERNFSDGAVRQTLFLGKTENRIFTPSHSFATRLTPDMTESYELDEPTALKYLRGLTFECPRNLKGWCLATYCNLPLGWFKAVNGTAKNHYPKGLRI